MKLHEAPLAASTVQRWVRGDCVHVLLSSEKHSWAACAYVRWRHKEREML